MPWVVHYNFDLAFYSPLLITFLSYYLFALLLYQCSPSLFSCRKSCTELCLLYHNKGKSK